MAEVYNAIQRFYGRHFSASDKRLMKLPNGSKRPKWKNNENGVLATVTHQKQKWLVLIDEANDFWRDKAARKTPKRSFKKKCRKCRSWNPLKNKVCHDCGTQFPATPEKRLID